MGALLALKAAEQAPIGGLILLAPEPPAAIRPPAPAHELRDVPEVYGRARIGWSTLPEKLQRDHRDLTIADVLRIQHLLGQKPHESGRARRSVLAGVAIDPTPFAEIPRLVIGGGLDQVVPEPMAERVAEWLGADYEPFGAHSHYGLIVGEQSHQQVADAIRGFLEANRL
jgi:pimeloyl-ACP methyl ester carboxylesterase